MTAARACLAGEVFALREGERIRDPVDIVFVVLEDRVVGIAAWRSVLCLLLFGTVHGRQAGQKVLLNGFVDDAERIA